MKKLVLFILVFQISFLEFVFARSPTSGVPEGSAGGYKFPCYIWQLSGKNIKSFTLSDSSSTIPYDIVENKEIENQIVQHGRIITANCTDDTFVFNENAKSQDKTKSIKSFELRCNNGGFESKGKFCDRKCDILPLKKAGYTIPFDALYPMQKVEIKCPSGETTRYGDLFSITCGKDGILESPSPRCFNKKSSCKFPFTQGAKQINVPSGHKLSCSNDYGLTILNCDNGNWIDMDTCDKKCQAECKEDIADVAFEYEDINLVITKEIDDVLDLGELVDFCKENPQDEECQVTYPTCTFRGREDYQMGDMIKLKCPKADNKVIHYQCFDGWVASGFDDADALSFSPPSIKYCGDNAEIREYIPAKKPNDKTKKQTLREYKLEVLRSKSL